MRKFFRMSIIMLFCMLGFLGITSCDKTVLSPPATQDYVDKAVASSIEKLEAITNPTFESINEVLTLRQQMIDNNDIDGLFLSIDEAVLKEVAGVLLKRGAPCTKKTIVQEYINHEDVYSNLSSAEPAQDPPVEPNAQPPARAVEEEQPTASISMQDTVINGKKAKITTRIDYE